MTKKSTFQQRGKTLEQRFYEKVIKSDGCWEWASAKQGAGYGVFWVGGGKSENAHRMAWLLHNKSEIPAGMVVMHICNNKGCVNPSHLEIGTPQENSLMASKDGLAPRGEKNGGGGKLKEHQVVEIFNNDEFGCSRLSKMYGVSTQTIKAIRKGKIWRHVTKI